MKKVLAVLLSVMMLFGALSFSSSAASTSIPYFNEINGNPALANPRTQVIVVFQLLGGTLKSGVNVYDEETNKFTWVEGFDEPTYIMLPRNSEDLKPESVIQLPAVTPPSGYSFDGWHCRGVAGIQEYATYAANSAFEIPAGSAGQVIEFRAAYSPAEIEPDTMETIMTILVKVFGTIIGLLFLSDAQAGMEMMENLLGQLLG